MQFPSINFGIINRTPYETRLLDGLVQVWNKLGLADPYYCNTIPEGANRSYYAFTALLQAILDCISVEQKTAYHNGYNALFNSLRPLPSEPQEPLPTTNKDA